MSWLAGGKLWQARVLVNNALLKQNFLLNHLYRSMSGPMEYLLVRLIEFGLVVLCNLLLFMLLIKFYWCIIFLFLSLHILLFYSSVKEHTEEWEKCLCSIKEHTRVLCYVCNISHVIVCELYMNSTCFSSFAFRLLLLRTTNTACISSPGCYW